MIDIFFTSDLHLNHNKGFIYEPRGFSNCHEHSLGIIDNINQVVKEDDELYILGDVMLEDDEKGLYYFNRIKCHNIHIILGNHDSDKRIEIFKSLDNVKELCFATRIKLKKWTFYLSHYPANTCNDADKKNSAIVFNLCGHTHTKDRFIEMRRGTMSYHVELDCHDNYPISIQDIKQDIIDFKNNVISMKNDIVKS